jgi:CHAD domain-containing protein
MAYRIRRREDFAAGLIRLLRNDLERAHAELRASGRREQRIHKIRQRLKRMRTILRVLEPAFGEDAIAARRALAAAARLLARARDADVAAASARVLAAGTADSDAGFGQIADTLDHEAERAHAERTPLGKVALHFAAAEAHIAGFDTSFDGRDLLQQAIEHAYRKGRRAMRQAETTLATSDLHAWRKSVKHLWHLLVMARKRLPKMAGRRAERLGDLGELLGLDHDHAALAEKLALSPEGDPALMSQLAIIAERRRALEAQASAVGRRIYRRKLRDFARRLHLA